MGVQRPPAAEEGRAKADQVGQERFGGAPEGGGQGLLPTPLW